MTGPFVVIGLGAGPGWPEASRAARAPSTATAANPTIRDPEGRSVKKGRLVEEAILHHLQALRELPADVIIPPRLVLTRESFAKVATLVRRPRKPTKALRDLMAGRRVAGAD